MHVETRWSTKQVPTPPDSPRMPLARSSLAVSIGDAHSTTALAESICVLPVCVSKTST